LKCQWFNEVELEKEIHQKSFRNEAHKLGVNIIYTFNWLDHFQSAILKPFGITSQQFNVLRILRGQHPNPSSVKLIRQRMLDKMSDASRIVEKLRLKGLVERNTSPSDRRECEVLITGKGLDLLARADKEFIQMDALFSTLKPDEIHQLNLLLDKMRG
jgi:DNA-binding MarR family transcriptional regulator